MTDETIQRVINEKKTGGSGSGIQCFKMCQPIEKIVARAMKWAVVVMDGAQSVPHMPVDVQKLDVDFMAFQGITHGTDGNRCIIWKEGIA